MSTSSSFNLITNESKLIYDSNKVFSINVFFRNANIVDNMIRMMESYTDQLEHLVDERTTQLAEEKAKTDELLYKMLPK